MHARRHGFFGLLPRNPSECLWQSIKQQVFLGISVEIVSFGNRVRKFVLLAGEIRDWFCAEKLFDLCVWTLFPARIWVSYLLFLSSETLIACCLRSYVSVPFALFRCGPVYRVGIDLIAA